LDHVGVGHAITLPSVWLEVAGAGYAMTFPGELEAGLFVVAGAAPGHAKVTPCETGCGWVSSTWLVSPIWLVETSDETGSEGAVSIGEVLESEFVGHCVCWPCALGPAAAKQTHHKAAAVNLSH
jgi:hypothetical protein